MDSMRFAFGRNWRQFLENLNEDRIYAAEKSVRALFRCDRLDGRRFLDIGSGSGLFSLVARRLGATVHSFDYDSDSVACTASLRERFFPGDRQWTIERGSAIDETYMSGHRGYDIVYSWGVLHHTGNMWKGLQLTAQTVAPNGQMCIALYNDQGGASRRWTTIKKGYQKLPGLFRPMYVAGIAAMFETRYAVARALRGQNPFFSLSAGSFREERGMSAWHDWVDWVGGYPFEVATPDQVFDFFQARGFQLQFLKTRQGLGCNEFVFEKTAAAPALTIRQAA